MNTYLVYSQPPLLTLGCIMQPSGLPPLIERRGRRQDASADLPVDRRNRQSILDESLADSSQSTDEVLAPQDHKRAV